MRNILLAIFLVFMPFVARAGGENVSQDSLFWPTSGVGDGNASGYTSDQWAWLNRMLWIDDPTAGGVALNYLGTLTVTNPAGRTLRVAPGGAIVYGFPYQSTADVDFTLTLPVINTTGWRIVLRADWATQTVRVVLLESADGVAAIPAVTQAAGVTWEIPIASGTITVAPAIEISHARTYFNPGIRIDEDHIADRTRHFWVSPNAGWNITDGTVIVRDTDLGLAFPDLKLSAIYAWFEIPQDYVSDMTITAVIQPKTTSANIYSQILAKFATCGEVYNTHSLIPGFGAVAVTGDIYNCIDALALTGVAVGDFVTVTWSRSGLNALDTTGQDLYFFGFYVSYIADM